MMVQRMRLKKKIVKKIMSYILGIAMAVSVLSLSSLGTVEVKAAANTKDVNLNDNNIMAGIDDPSTSATDKWTGSKVFFGNKLWRVLDNDHASNGDSNAAFLFSEEILESKPYHDNEDKFITWEVCSLRAYLNGDTFLDGNFTNIEKNAIPALEITNPANRDIFGGNNTRDKIFLLSFEEVQKSEYGMPEGKYYDNTRKAGNIGNTYSWWLRSPGSGDIWHSMAASVSLYGDVNLLGTSITYAVNNVRPAFNLNLSSILFSSASGASKSAFGYVGNSNVNANTWKLTLKGTETTLSANKTSGNTNLQMGYGAETITIEHSEATTLADATQVSAMLTSSDGTVLYYGLINDDISATSSSVIIPTGLSAGSYSLYIFAEDINNGNTTDYASALGTPISITVTAPSATIGNVTVSGTTGSENTATDVTISLMNEQFNAISEGANVSSWFTNMPTDLSAKMRDVITANDTTATITISGTPCSTSSDALSVTIPGTNLVSGSELTVTSNADAKWSIVTPGQVVAPTFSPTGGTYVSDLDVTLFSTTSGATVYYTTNGDTPSTSSTEYTAPITVLSPMDIKAIAVKKGMINSDVAIATYILPTPTQKVIAPSFTFSPTGGTDTSAQNVTLSSTTSEATIYYTTNGDTPSTSSTEYTAPITVLSTMTIKAIAVKTGMTNSDVAIATYILPTPTPTPSDNSNKDNNTTQSDSGSQSGNLYTIEQQGAACKAAFKTATPKGFKEAFSFNLSEKENGILKTSASKKTGKFEMCIPKEYQKTGRTFMLIGIDKYGNTKLFMDENTSISATLDIDGYAFSLIYTDGAVSKSPTTTDGNVYVVKNGDVLSNIAENLGKTTTYLAKKNQLSNPYKLKIGQKIYY